MRPRLFALLGFASAAPPGAAGGRSSLVVAKRSVRDLALRTALRRRVPDAMAAAAPRSA